VSQRSHDNNGNDHKGNGDKNNSPQHDERSPLHDPVDWMTFSHEDLYKMVHTGVNLEGAQAAATNWKKIGEDIAGVRANLLKAVEDSTVGWDSESARLARDGLTEVTNWVDDTANYAHKVSAAITTETSNVEAARAAMPPPPAPPASPAEPTVLRPALRDRLAMADQVDGFGAQTLRDPRLVPSLQGEFAGFETVGTSPVETLAANDAQHRLAADVMASFQRNSAAVDQTVPAQFTPPVNPLNPAPTSGTDLGGRSNTGLPDGGPGAGGGGGGTVATGTQNQNRGTTNTSSRYGGSSGYGGGRGGGGGGGAFAGGMARPFGTNSGSQAGGGGGAGGGGSAGGGAAGVNEGVRGGAGAAAAAASSATGGGQTKAFQNPLAMGGAPMAGAPVAGGGRDDNREHKTASYLEEDDNVFGLDRKAAPPVIGQ
jgi:hypothetical protein